MHEKTFKKQNFQTKCTKSPSCGRKNCFFKDLSCVHSTEKERGFIYFCPINKHPVGLKSLRSNTVSPLSSDGGGRVQRAGRCEQLQ
ncbi:hypothetical protein ILYODFUR_031633 [Ilyodon furcidens]|uniref:Uncharacterized protein n=1 Tax=Ilyodon furcidens TaxID=33524 RepID=A0ABV0UNI9_9TELE